MKYLYSLFKRLLKGLPSCYEAHPTTSLIYNRSLYSVGEVVLTRRASRIDQANSAHVVVSYLIPDEIYWVV